MRRCSSRLLLSTIATAQSGPRARLVVGEGLNEPFAVDFDAAGRMFIAEMGGNRVSVWDRRALTPLATPFNGPHHLITGPDAQIYVADTWAHVVRRVDPATGVVTRLAGTGEKGFSGDGGPAVDAQFGSVFAIAIHDGGLYVADLDNRRIRKVTLATGIVETVAGNGEKGVPVDGADARAQPLVDPRAVAVDSAGQIYICERGGHALRVVDATGGSAPLLARARQGFSGDGGPALNAAMNGPKHISIDADGSVLDHRHREPRDPALRADHRQDRARCRHRPAGRGWSRGPAGPAPTEPPARRVPLQGRAVHFGQREPPCRSRSISGLVLLADPRFVRTTSVHPPRTRLSNPRSLKGEDRAVPDDGDRHL